MIRNATDLTPTEKAAVETLLIRRVQHGEAVSVRAIEQARIIPKERLKIANDLKKYFIETDATRKPISESEQEDAITEAMRNVRPRFRPPQHETHFLRDKTPHWR